MPVKARRAGTLSLGLEEAKEGTMAKAKHQVLGAEAEDAEAALKVEQEIEAARAAHHPAGTVAGRAPHEYVDEESSGSAEADLERKQAEERGKD